MVEIRDFRVEVSEADIADLRARLKRTRWPDAETVSDWSQGIPRAYVRELAGYWAEDYDMYRVAHRLNAYPQFHATIGDVGIHFLHVRSPRRGARPAVGQDQRPGAATRGAHVQKVDTHIADDAFHVVI